MVDQATVYHNTLFEKVAVANFFFFAFFSTITKTLVNMSHQIREPLNHISELFGNIIRIEIYRKWLTKSV